MPSTQTKLEAEFERRCDAGIARGLTYLQAWQEIQEKDPVFFDRWQNEPWEMEQAAKVAGQPKPAPTRKEKEPGVRPAPVEEDEDDDDDCDCDPDDDDCDCHDDDDDGDSDASEDDDQDGDDQASTMPTPTKKDDNAVKRKKSPSKAAFVAAVAEKQRAGMTHSDAARAVAKAHPKLRQAMIDEANANGRQLAVPPVRGSGVQAEVDAAIAAKMRAALSKREAARAVFKEQPQLRERFVAAANQRR